MEYIISKFLTERQDIKWTRIMTSLIIALQINFFFSNSAFAATQDEKFHEGIQFYQTKDFQKATEAFQSALSLGPDNLDILVNLGLAKFQLGKKGEAIGIMRHVLGFSPDNEIASSALRYMIQKLPTQELAHEISFFESLRENLLKFFALPHMLFLNSILFAFIGIGLINYLARRRIAIRDEKELPQFSPIFILLFLCLIITTGLIGLKIFDSLRPRGTIVVEKASVKSGPTDESPEIYEIYEGLEVLINEEYNNWMQVTYPGGLTGWLPKAAVMQTNISTSRLTKTLQQQ